MLPIDLKLPCQHEPKELQVRGWYAACGVCGSLLDVEHTTKKFTYDAAYPALRAHFDPEIGTGKVATLLAWLTAAGMDLNTITSLCEVGFGGGSCLLAMHARKLVTYGVEVVRANIDHAIALGVPAEHLYEFAALPAQLPHPVDLWLFQDSFEHLSDPATFMTWVEKNAVPGCRMLLVLPRADAFSRRLLGRLWPHRVPDHPFHWSRPGLTEFLAQRGWQLVRYFNPVKYINIKTILNHGLHKAGLSRYALLDRLHLPLLRWTLRFNFGEMGLWLIYQPQSTDESSLHASRSTKHDAATTGSPL